LGNLPTLATAPLDIYNISYIASKVK
jgi:hypothetical protein